MGKRSNDCLPEDMVMDIQLRLPVKSLLRFRCVFKPWCARFQNPNFITAHHLKQHVLNGHNYANSNMLLKRFHGDGRCFYPYYFTSLKSDFDNHYNIDEVITVNKKENIYMPFTNDWLSVPTVIGPVNGIVCLVDCHRLGLWNPATREFKLLPESTIKHPPESCINGVGFGFDLKTNDYKVVRFIFNFHSLKNVQTEIYTLSNNSWREIPTYNYKIGGNSVFNTYINGVYHWKSELHPDGSYVTPVILSFDMVDEVFTTTSLPNGFIWLFHDWYIASIDECPAAIIYQCPAPMLYQCTANNFYEREATEECYDVWVLKELGVTESWVKQLTIGPILGIERPLGFWKNGWVFMENNDNQLVLYDPSTQVLKNLQICSNMYSMQLIIYVESLVPINGRQEVTHVTLS